MLIDLVGDLPQQETRELLLRENNMADTNTLQMINSIPKFDGTDYVEWSRSLNDILLIFWPFLSKIVSGQKKN